MPDQCHRDLWQSWYIVNFFDHSPSPNNTLVRSACFSSLHNNRKGLSPVDLVSASGFRSFPLSLKPMDLIEQSGLNLELILMFSNQRIIPDACC